MTTLFNKKFICLGLIVGISLCLSPRSSLAAKLAAGKVVFVAGEATVTRLPQKQAEGLEFSDPIYLMDILETGSGELKIRLSDRSVLHLLPNSKVIITEHVFNQAKGERRSILDIAKGNVRTIIQKLPNLKQNDVRLQTPAAVAAIRGTDVVTSIKAKKKGGVITQFLLDSGLLDVYSIDHADAVVQIKPGQYVSIHEGFPPSAPLEMSGSLRQMIFSDQGNLSEVLQMLSAPSESSSTSSESSSLPPNFGDTESNPGALSERTRPSSTVDTPTPSAPENQAPVKVPVTFEERR